MDNRVRLNENCIIGQPHCGYAFSSARTCFIAYGFKTSSLEVTILKKILEKHDVLPIEAGNVYESGKNAFCTKICSKIISSQFCIALLNFDKNGKTFTPNANVMQEYGMMLGFNKFIIPFQKEDQALPFNVSGLDTVKYNQSNFENLAENAVVAAIAQTNPVDDVYPWHEILKNYLLSKNLILPDSIDDHSAIIARVNPLGFLLLSDFSCMNYTFLGQFSHLSVKNIKWRMEKLPEACKGIVENANERVLVNNVDSHLLTIFKGRLLASSILIIVSDKLVAKELTEHFGQNYFPFSVEIVLQSSIDQFSASLEV